MCLNVQVELYIDELRIEFGYLSRQDTNTMCNFVNQSAVKEVVYLVVACNAFDFRQAEP